MFEKRARRGSFCDGLEAAEKVCKKLFRVFYSRDENPKLFCVFDLTVTLLLL